MSKKFSVMTPGISIISSIDNNPQENLNTRHCHDSFEILFIVSGKGRAIIEGNIFDVKAGTLMIICPFEYHCLQMDKNEVYERYVIHFKPNAPINSTCAFLNSIAGNSSVNGRIYSACSIPNGVYTLFERFETVLSIPNGENEERNIYVKLLLSELLILLSISGGEQMSSNTDELGARVIKYLNENIDKNISLDRLAKKFFVSKYYLCRAFKKHNGISVHGYINQKRVMYAKQLIDSGETASGAAYRVGFGDYSAFYRAYVKIIGKAPTAE